MLTSTPKKAVSSEASLIKCLICAESLENNQRIAVFGRSQWDLSGTISKILGGELQPTCKGSQYVCKKKCFPRLIKVEKMMSSLKTLQDELREEVSQKNAVRVKRGLSEEVSVAPSFEAARNVKSPMKSINKTLFPSNARETPTRFPSAVQIIGYQTVRPSVPVVVRAFPNCVNTWHHNFFPAGTCSRQDIPVFPTQMNRPCQANKDTRPKGNAAENPSVQVSELFLLPYQVQYILCS